MSSFMVNKKSIDAIVTYVFKHKEQRFLSVQDEQELGQKLVSLNNRAVNTRYSEATEEPAYTYAHRSISLAAVYKAIACLLYQCTEADIDPADKTLEGLFSIRTILAARIITEMPEYVDAPWG